MEKPSSYIKKLINSYEYEGNSGDDPIFKLVFDYFEIPEDKPNFRFTDVSKATYRTFMEIQKVLRKFLPFLEEKEREQDLEYPDRQPRITENTLEGIAYIASIYDQSGDPDLIKKADVLDELLFTISQDAPKKIQDKKAADQAELDRLRATYKRKQEDLYKGSSVPKEAQDAQKKVNEQIPKSKLNQMPLSHRNCPDHPGTQTMRLADGTFQCSLDKKVYNFRDGFTTMQGTKVPGGAVENQTKFDPGLSEETIFTTRETRQNS